MEIGEECIALVLTSFKLNVCNIEGSTFASWVKTCPDYASKYFSASLSWLHFQV